VAALGIGHQARLGNAAGKLKINVEGWKTKER
jgi:hypothetical protein